MQSGGRGRAEHSARPPRIPCSRTLRESRIQPIPGSYRSTHGTDISGPTQNDSGNEWVGFHQPIQDWRSQSIGPAQRAGNSIFTLERYENAPERDFSDLHEKNDAFVPVYTKWEDLAEPIVIYGYKPNLAAGERGAPNAKDSQHTCTEGEEVVVELPVRDVDDVLSELEYNITDKPDHGTIQHRRGTKLVYQSDDGFAGEDEITYRVTDPGGRSDTATVAITVQPDKDTSAKKSGK